MPTAHRHQSPQVPGGTRAPSRSPAVCWWSRRRNDTSIGQVKRSEIQQTTLSEYWTMKSDLVKARCARVSHCIHDVHATGLETRKDKSGPRLGRIRVTAGARVPAAVMDLVTDIRHLQTMNHLPHTHNGAVVTGSIARRAKRRYMSYSEGDFEVFRPAGATGCTDGGVTPLCQISPHR